MKVRLDELLIERELADDLRVARGLIMAGKVVVAGVVCNKVGTSFRPDVEVHVRGRPLKFVSRGGYKLEAALVAFGIDVTGRVVLDAGASTGGFTDCLLQRGAARVYAVDVGFGQLRGKLATDPRVVNLERTNISDVVRDALNPGIDLAVGDLSNLTLRKAIPIIAALFEGAPELVMLVKPLFEGVQRPQMADADGLLTGLEALGEALAELGFGIGGLIASPILGGRASVEFLAHIRGGAPLDFSAAAAAAVAAIPNSGSTQ